MKWLRKPADSLIDYVADRFYDRLREHALNDLAPFLGKELDQAHGLLDQWLGWLP